MKQIIFALGIIIAIVIMVFSIVSNNITMLTGAFLFGVTMSVLFYNERQEINNSKTHYYENTGRKS